MITTLPALSKTRKNMLKAVDLYFERTSSYECIEKNGTYYGFDYVIRNVSIVRAESVHRRVTEDDWSLGKLDDGSARIWTDVAQINQHPKSIHFSYHFLKTDKRFGRIRCNLSRQSSRKFDRQATKSP